jgi:hypothetical protein
MTWVSLSTSSAMKRRPKKPTPPALALADALEEE